MADTSTLKVGLVDRYNQQIVDKKRRGKILKKAEFACTSNDASTRLTGATGIKMTPKTGWADFSATLQVFGRVGHNVSLNASTKLYGTSTTLSQRFSIGLQQCRAGFEPP